MTTGPITERHERVRAKARTHFDKWALSYDRSILNEIVFFPSVRACQEEIERWKAGRPSPAAPYALLDVGCGTGTFISIQARDPLAARVVGLDYSPVMARRAAEKAAALEHAAKVGVVVADSERLPFADRSFDVITCCNSFHHYPHQAAVIAGMRRVLRPGGMLVLIDGFRDNVIGWVVFDIGVTAVERHVHHASWSSIRAMVEAAGFAELRQRKMQVLAPLLVNVALNGAAEGADQGPVCTLTAGPRRFDTAENNPPVLPNPPVLKWLRPIGGLRRPV